MGWSRWWFYAKNVVDISLAYARAHPDELCVYELGDVSRNTVYYGSGKIKTRLLDHLNKKECPMASYYRFELFSDETECGAREEELLEEYKRRRGKLPMYNEGAG